jgi:hypothetical protein
LSVAGKGVVAIDGKTLRRSFDNAARGNPLAGLGRIVLDPGASAANPCGGLGEVRPAAPAPHAPGLGDVLRLLPR